jgi:hypothetical protein
MLVKQIFSNTAGEEQIAQSQIEEVNAIVFTG